MAIIPFRLRAHETLGRLRNGPKRALGHASAPDRWAGGCTRPRCTSPSSAEGKTNRGPFPTRIARWLSIVYSFMKKPLRAMHHSTKAARTATHLSEPQPLSRSGASYLRFHRMPRACDRSMPGPRNRVPCRREAPTLRPERQASLHLQGGRKHGRAGSQSSQDTPREELHR
jgi:hypothetical protein